MHAELTIQPVLVAHTPVGCTVDIEEEEGGTQEAAQGAAGPGELDLGDDAFRNRLIGPLWDCLLYTSPSPRDATLSRMPSSA